MADTLSPKERSERMSRIRSRDTQPELRVRRLIHGLGYRYRLHCSDLPGTPDLVFRKRKRVIFVHGCFWHQHPDPKCKLTRLPKSRLDFWGPKLRRNHERDEEILARLRQEGWRVLIVWECLTHNDEELKENIVAFLEGK